MRIFKFGKHALFSSHFYKPNDYSRGMAKWTLTKNIKHVFLRRRLFREIVNGFYGKKPAFKMLEAHGNSYKDIWLFGDGKRVRKVQKWINAHDAYGTVLLIVSCNPGKSEITARKSIVLHMNMSGSFLYGMRGQVGMRIFVPGIGYCDTHYRLRKVLSRSKKGSRSKSRSLLLNVEISTSLHIELLQSP